MKVRLITGLAILAFIIPSLLYGGWLLNLLIGCIVIFGGNEYLNLSEHKNKWPKYFQVLILASIFAIILVPVNLAVPLMGLLALCILSFPVFSDKFDAKDAFLSISCITLFYFIATSFLNIYEKNPNYIWMIIIATYCCDTMAYFSGSFFGKHKLNTRISPKKTIEGSIGGWFFGALFAFLFAFYFIEELNLVGLLVTSVILPISGQIGDLAFSAIKRCYGIKDFSNLLPGHGGVLDRLDSLIFNFICFHFILVVIGL